MDSTKGPWIHGFAITGVGSLRSEKPALVGPLGKMNFLVGRNNHGKSTILRQVRFWVTDSSNKLPQLRATDESMKALTLVPINRSILQKSLPRHIQRSDDAGAEFLATQGWVEIDTDHVGVWTNRLQGSAQEQAMVFFDRTVGHMAPRHGAALAFGPTYAKSHVLIPAFRLLRPAPPEKAPDSPRRPQLLPDLASGEGLIAELARWQNPTDPGSAAYETSRGRWRKLKAFLRDVLEDPDADIEVASNQTDLHVQLAQAGRMLKIDDLGDGIKQILMIAAACVYYDGSFVCLEEPEIHLHAGLQRKLLRFLAGQTSSQYLIATHSAHVLDLPDARIFHVTHDGEKTSVSPAVRASEVQRVCQDLGYMASDLLQANYVIWVEGPSDRIYWRQWLQLVDPELEEGVHFTIMVYGGYLLETIRTDSEDEPEVADIEDDLIHILKLGRACTVITDSDKTAPDSQLRPVVQRLQKEADLDGSGVLVVCDWVRTVENLIPRPLFRNTVIELHSKAGMRLRTADSPFASPFDGMRKGSYSKVRIAQAIAPKLTKLHIGPQLMLEVEGLASRVRAANGLPTQIP